MMVDLYGKWEFLGKFTRLHPYIWLIFRYIDGKLVGRYTSPMDHMGNGGLMMMFHGNKNRKQLTISKQMHDMYPQKHTEK